MDQERIIEVATRIRNGVKLQHQYFDDWRKKDLSTAALLSGSVLVGPYNMEKRAQDTAELVRLILDHDEAV